MRIFLIIVIVLLLLIVAILLSKIKVNLWVRKNGKDDEIVVRIRMIFGLVRLHYELPMMKFKEKDKGIFVEVDKTNNVGHNKEKHNETLVDKQKIDNWLDQFLRVLEATHSFNLWLKRTLSRLTVTKLEWSTNFCAGDAAYTAVSTGMVWSTKTFIVGWLSHYVKMKDHPRLFVVPEYDDYPHFSSEMSCIVKFSCGYAIYAGLVLIVRVLKVKGGVKRWKTILSKA
ncbi:DUF2953 domain-containing protein [Paenibacillus crassostreae]|uniref:DUF2953 domain-containing protein n=1 Tax=Paenibacillus crassostreae TaxID=1763538 RepID=A0A167DJ08_9BACL|nr:DUF2953 domain-containing protein [Paenibacillus crassostreae]AOZ91411.1 hypothetical protein LPB68_03775 [Paenibacillus crassostreae]OAB74430.1 hypothetical protein PNBC_10185 [Paenibacillus crassostreae]